jgi:hypothetical protein
MDLSFHKYYNSGIKSHWSDQSHDNISVKSGTEDVTKSNSSILIHGCKAITPTQNSVLKNMTLYSTENQVIVRRNISPSLGLMINWVRSRQEIHLTPLPWCKHVTPTLQISVTKVSYSVITWFYQDMYTIMSAVKPTAERYANHLKKMAVTSKTSVPRCGCQPTWATIDRFPLLCSSLLISFPW